MNEAREITHELTKLVERVQGNYEVLNENVETYNEAVKSQMMGARQAKEQHEHEKSALEEVAHTEGGRLLKRVETARETARRKAEEGAESITADQVAELELLGTLDPTQEDLEKYGEKYKNNPLALRALRKIATDRGTFFVEPETDVNKKLIIYKKLENIAAFYASLRVRANDPVTTITPGMHLQELKELRNTIPIPVNF